MASKKAKMNYRQKLMKKHMIDEPDRPGMMDEDEMPRMQSGGLIPDASKVLQQREALAMQAAGITPAAPPVVPVPPTQVPIIPGAADAAAAKMAAWRAQEAAAEKARLEADAAKKKKFLGLFADGGSIWPRQEDATNPAATTSYDMSSLQSLGLRSGAQVRNPLDNSAPGYKFDRTKMMFDPKAGPAPLVSDSMPGATGTVMSDSQWNTMGNKTNPKTGYPMMADGGSVSQATALYNAATDNLSTARFAKKYDGLGGVRDIPAFANGGSPWDRLKGLLTPAPAPTPTPTPSPNYSSNQIAGQGVVGQAQAGRMANLEAIEKKAVGRANGGVAGGKVYGEGGPTEDKVKIRVSPGEFVLPADTVKAVGAAGLRRLIAETHTPVKAPGYGNGWWGKTKNAWTGIKDALTPASKAVGGQDMRPDFAAIDKEYGGISDPEAEYRSRPSKVPPITAGQKLRGLANRASAVVDKVAPPILLGSTAVETADTPTEDYRKRFGLETNDPSLIGDVGVRALGAASDLGNIMGFGLPGKYLYRDKMEAATKPPTPGLRSTSSVDPSKTEGWGMGDRGLGGITKPHEFKQNTFSNKDIAPVQAAGPEGPSIADTNAAARAEMQAMDARKAAENAAEGRRLDDMNLRGQQAGAAWDRQVALSRKDPQMYANAVRNEELLKEGSNRTLARDLKTMDETGANTRAGVMAAAAKYRDDMGLRGQMVASQTSLLGHLMNQQMTMAQLQHTMGRENAKDFQEELATRAQVFIPGKDGGPPVLDSAATAKNIANLKRFQIDPTADHLAILNAIKPGAKSINEIPREHWGSILDKALTNIGIGAATGGQGMPARYGIKERGLADTFAGPGRNSQVGVVSTLLNNINPFAPPERNLTLSTETPGSLPMDSVLEDVLSGDRGRAESIIHALRQSPKPQEVAVANKLAERLGIR